MTVVQPKQRVAVVGTGVAGVAAAWLFSLDPEKFEVVMYEKNNYIGGHTHTVDYTSPLKQHAGGGSVPVDTGFIVFNNLTYPNFIQFLDYLSVKHIESDMSFAVSRNSGQFEWAGSSLRSLFAQRSNLISPRFWLMILDIMRFNNMATELLLLPAGSSERSVSIGEYLKRHGYSRGFAEDYLLPMTAAIWSTAADKCWSEFPAETLIRFMHNHCLLQVFDRPAWRTVAGGSKKYLDAALETLKDNIRTSTAVVGISRVKSTRAGQVKVSVTDANGNQELFDKVIVAAHGDEALRMLRDPSKEEMETLKRVKFSRNRAVLHCDSSLMPRRPDTWSSWNVLTTANSINASKEKQVCLTYWMNKLQSIDKDKYGQIFVTMNPLNEPDPQLVIEEYSYTHPLYNQELIEAQRKLKALNKTAAGGETNTLFCGAWANYGFHEDGLTAGLVAAELLGAKCPFSIQDSTHLRSVVGGSSVGNGWKGILGLAVFWLFQILDLLMSSVGRWLLPKWLIV